MTCSSSSVPAAGAVTVGSVSTLLGPSRTRDAVEQYDRLLARWDLNEGDRAEVLAGRGMVLIYGLCAEDAIADAQLALALAERSGRGSARSRANEVLALAATLAGQGPAALRHARAAAAEQSLSGRMGGLTAAPHLTLAIAEFVFGTPSASLAAHRAWVDRCHRTGAAAARHHLYPLAAVAHLVRGELAEAGHVVEVALDLYDERHPAVGGPLAPALGCYLRHLAGERPAADRHAEQALASLAEGGARVSSADTAVWLVTLAREADGDVDGATDMLVAMWELVTERVGIHTISPDVVRLTRTTRPDLAARVAAGARARADHTRSDLDVANAAAAVGHLRGDGGMLLEAARLFDRAEWHLAAVRARGHAVPLLAAAGERAEALALAAGAIEAWQQMGAVQPVQLLRSQERALGVRRRSPGRRREAALGPASLTDAERRVARLVADGLTNRQIAERLYVSRRTVDTHVAASLAKLTLTSRVQLAALVATGVVH